MGNPNTSHKRHASDVFALANMFDTHKQQQSDMSAVEPKRVKCTADGKHALRKTIQERPHTVTLPPPLLSCLPSLWGMGLCVRHIIGQRSTLKHCHHDTKNGPHIRSTAYTSTYSSVCTGREQSTIPCVSSRKSDSRSSTIADMEMDAL